MSEPMSMDEIDALLDAVAGQDTEEGRERFPAGKEPFDYLVPSLLQGAQKAVLEEIFSAFAGDLPLRLDDFGEFEVSLAGITAAAPALLSSVMPGDSPVALLAAEGLPGHAIIQLDAPLARSLAGARPSSGPPGRAIVRALVPVLDTMGECLGQAMGATEAAAFHTRCVCCGPSRLPALAGEGLYVVAAYAVERRGAGSSMTVAVHAVTAAQALYERPGFASHDADAPAAAWVLLKNGTATVAQVQKLKAGSVLEIDQGAPVQWK